VPSEASRRETTVLRIVRDTKQARRIKELYDYGCQMCGTRLEGLAGPYAEAAHIRPLGAPHNGPDSPDNILCLCPNHHVLFDHGGVGIGEDFPWLARRRDSKSTRDTRSATSIFGIAASTI
jgi:putative restriction endonuclease